MGKGVRGCNKRWRVWGSKGFITYRMGCIVHVNRETAGVGQEIVRKGE